MAEPAKLTIVKDFARPDASLLDGFWEAPTGWVVDALGRKGALPHWVRPLTSKTRFVGSALTVRTRHTDNLAPYAALKFAKPGDVLVVATDGDETGSVMGDVLIGMAKNAGILAVVTDGLVRDISGIDQVGIPVFARALSPNSPLKDGPGTIGLPVAIGGVAVASGDVVVGDIDGVVVVPRSRALPALEEIQSIAAKEASMERAVAEGTRYPAWLDALLDSDAVRYVE